MNYKKLVLLSASLVFLFSCKKNTVDDSDSRSVSKEENGVFLQEINTEPLVQYTPNLSPCKNYLDGPLKDYPAYDDGNGFHHNANTGAKSNALKDIPLMTEKAWEDNYWEGTPFNPEKLTRVELVKALFPNDHGIMLGLKQLYERHKPFKDEVHPTLAEINEWDRLVINHFRALLGLGAETKAKNSHGLYISALWTEEVKYTTKWDNDFYRDGKTVLEDKNSTGKPGDKDYYLNRPHYGFGFIAPVEKQKEYYPEGITPTFYQMLSEGATAVRIWEPWSTKMTRILYGFLSHEGFWGGHLGPIWKSEYIGISYYKRPPEVGEDTDPNRNIWLGVRMQYHGNEDKGLRYIDPDGPQTGGAGSSGSKY